MAVEHKSLSFDIDNVIGNSCLFEFHYDTHGGSSDSWQQNLRTRTQVIQNSTKS